MLLSNLFSFVTFKTQVNKDKCNEREEKNVKTFKFKLPGFQVIGICRRSSIINR
jgi:hypothetical protein